VPENVSLPGPASYSPEVGVPHGALQFREALGEVDCAPWIYFVDSLYWVLRHAEQRSSPVSLTMGVGSRI
jgi:hypothetical protein